MKRHYQESISQRISKLKNSSTTCFDSSPIESTPKSSLMNTPTCVRKSKKIKPISSCSENGVQSHTYYAAKRRKSSQSPFRLSTQSCKFIPSTGRAAQEQHANSNSSATDGVVLTPCSFPGVSVSVESTYRSSSSSKPPISSRRSARLNTVFSSVEHRVKPKLNETVRYLAAESNILSASHLTETSLFVDSQSLGSSKSPRPRPFNDLNEVNRSLNRVPDNSAAQSYLYMHENPSFEKESCSPSENISEKLSIHCAVENGHLLKENALQPEKSPHCYQMDSMPNTEFNPLLELPAAGTRVTSTKNADNQLTILSPEIALNNVLGSNFLETIDNLKMDAVTSVANTFSPSLVEPTEFCLAAIDLKPFIPSVSQNSSEPMLGGASTANQLAAVHIPSEFLLERQILQGDRNATVDNFSSAVVHANEAENQAFFKPDNHATVESSQDPVEHSQVSLINTGNSNPSSQTIMGALCESLDDCNSPLLSASSSLETPVKRCGVCLTPQFATFPPSLPLLYNQLRPPSGTSFPTNMPSICSERLSYRIKMHAAEKLVLSPNSPSSVKPVSGRNADLSDTRLAEGENVKVSIEPAEMATEASLELSDVFRDCDQLGALEATNSRVSIDSRPEQSGLGGQSGKRPRKSFESDIAPGRRKRRRICCPPTSSQDISNTARANSVVCRMSRARPQISSRGRKVTKKNFATVDRGGVGSHLRLGLQLTGRQPRLGSQRRNTSTDDGKQGGCEVDPACTTSPPSPSASVSTIPCTDDSTASIPSFPTASNSPVTPRPSRRRGRRRRNPVQHPDSTSPRSRFDEGTTGRMSKARRRLHRDDLQVVRRTTTTPCKITRRRVGRPRLKHSKVFWRCPGCTLSSDPFDSPQSLLAHLPFCHKKLGGGGTAGRRRGCLWPSAFSVPGMGFGCSTCGAVVASESRLDKHHKDVHNKS